MGSSKSEIEKELTQIKAVLASFKEGASISMIEKALIHQIELRTLQRRLAKLEEAREIKSSGEKKGRRYTLVVADIPEIKAPGTGDKRNVILLSPESERLKQIITQPEEKRKRVGYNTAFLMSYRPNVDSYLSDAEKKKLAELGKTKGLDQPAGTYAKEIFERLLIDLSWNSSRLEGNTYSLLETQRLIVQGKAADDKSVQDAQMILNHKDAIEFIVRSADEIGFTHYFIIGLHALLSNNLLSERIASGRLRSRAVGIGRSVYTPSAIPQLIEEMFDLMLEKAEQIENPFEQAFFITVHLPYLQPFDDVNKRVSRLAVNIPLIKHNLSPLSFVDVPKDTYTYGLLGVYELNRIEILKDVFMWAYERSAWRYADLRQIIGAPDPFVAKYRQEIKDLVRDIVLSASPYEEAVLKIKQGAKKLPKEDQDRFIEIVDYDLLNLNENNIARFFIRPSEFHAWKKKWPL